MSIRRDLLLRSALLRQPDLPPLPPLRVATPAAPAPATRRKATSRRRPKRGPEAGAAQH